MLRSLIVLSLGSLAFASIGHAQRATSRFERLIEDGLNHREAGRDSSAISSFEQALRMQPGSGEARGQLALAELSAARRDPSVGAGHFLRALELLVETLANRHDDWVQRHRRTLEGEERTLRASFGILLIPGGTGTVRMISPGLDQERTLPLNLAVPVGRFTLSVRRPSSPALVQEVAIERGRTTTVADGYVPAHEPAAPSVPVVEVAPVPVVPVVEVVPIVLHRPSDVDQALPLPSALTFNPDSEMYRRRRSRLFGFGALFVASASVLGTATPATRTTSAGFGEPPTRTGLNRGMMGAAIASAALALALNVAGFVVRGKWRRSLAGPDPLALSF